MRRPYEPGKVPVVLIHGLGGFPQQWDRMVGYLEAEPGLRERYQFWLFRYESGDSIPFSAHLFASPFGRPASCSIRKRPTKPSTGWSSSVTAWAASWRK